MSFSLCLAFSSASTSAFIVGILFLFLISSRLFATSSSAESVLLACCAGIEAGVGGEGSFMKWACCSDCAALLNSGFWDKLCSSESASLSLLVSNSLFANDWRICVGRSSLSFSWANCSSLVLSELATGELLEDQNPSSFAQELLLLICRVEARLVGAVGFTMRPLVVRLGDADSLRVLRPWISFQKRLLTRLPPGVLLIHWVHVIITVHAHTLTSGFLPISNDHC